MVHKVILFRKHRELLKPFIFTLNSVFFCALTCAHTCRGSRGQKSVSHSLELEFGLFWGAHVNHRNQFWSSAREIQVISESHTLFLIPNFRFVFCSWLWELIVMQINRVYYSVALYAAGILMTITSISTLLISFLLFSFTPSHLFSSPFHSLHPEFHMCRVLLNMAISNVSYFFLRNYLVVLPRSS